MTDLIIHSRVQSVGKNPAVKYDERMLNFSDIYTTYVRADFMRALSKKMPSILLYNNGLILKLASLYLQYSALDNANNFNDFLNKAVKKANGRYNIITFNNVSLKTMFDEYELSPVSFSTRISRKTEPVSSPVRPGLLLMHNDSILR